MLMRTDPLGELSRLTQRLFGEVGNWAGPVVPMDAYRSGDTFVVHLDLPGMDPASIDLSVDRNVLTVKAERSSDMAGEGVELQVAERPHGTFSRQLFLGEALDIDQVEAHYDAGVLTLHIPLAEQAKPRKIAITGAGGAKQLAA
jgi:HSP20 family protein